MQIVIDIPEEMYLNAKADTLCGADILVKAIKNGIPHETVTEFADRCRECGAKYGKLLKQTPKTGHWIKVSDGYGDNAYICECSECKDTVWVYKDADRKWNFCPNCGVKMIEEQESEEV